MATYDALELEIIGQERREYILVPVDATPEEVLNTFLTMDGRWIQVQGEEPTYVRYETVASVKVRRLEDDDVPLAGLG